MKIEIGESLAYSYLRHVKHCWIVQANWKVPGPWGIRRTDAELESQFSEMRRRFDDDCSVFKTKDVKQFLKQGEIDVLGLDQKGGVHAIEVAFHEAGLKYDGGPTEIGNHVLQKMLRTLLILRAYDLPQTAHHVYFLSPTVRRAVQQRLDDHFDQLSQKYPLVGWQLLTNDNFAACVVRPTLEEGSSFADSSELFLRSAKMLKIADRKLERHGTAGRPRGSTPNGRIQPLVQDLMRTLLKDHPNLLRESEREKLADGDYCKDGLGLRLGFALIRKQRTGYETRYYKDPYGDFYVCNNWRKLDHHHNACRLLAFVKSLASTGTDRAKALRSHIEAFSDYVGANDRRLSE